MESMTYLFLSLVKKHKEQSLTFDNLLQKVFSLKIDAYNHHRKRSILK